MVKYDAVDKEEDVSNQPRQQPLLQELSDPEALVREWEYLHDTHLHKKLRDFAIKVAAVHIDEERGITVQDIQTLMGLRKIDAAERRKDIAVNMGLPVPHEKLKYGKQKMYFLTNYIDVINERIKRRFKEFPVSPDDITFALINVLSSHKSGYHHISLRTEMKYPNEDYSLLDRSSNWHIGSPQTNKTKTATFKLENRQNCTLNVSPNGTVMISIGCSRNQYKLHTYEGKELFVSSGQILSILQQEAGNRLNVVPHPNDWRIVQFDNDKTISIAEPERESPY